MEVYLDNSATTRVRPEVAGRMVEMMTREYGNPSSLHRKGFLAEQAVKEAREQLAAVLSAAPGELLFTSCGSESNNLAILGYCRGNKRAGDKIVTTQVEHESVLAPARQLAAEGYEVAYAAPRPDGTVDPRAVADQVDGRTALVSVMAVNSETGAINDLEAIARLAKEKHPGVRVHCDGVQAFCKLPLNPRRMGVDLLTASAHKIHGPKGAALLYAAQGVRLAPLYYGSGQERGLHPGTENTPAICGFGLAAQLLWREHDKNWQKMETLSRLLREKCSQIPGVCINSPINAAPYIMNLSIPSVRSEVMIHFLEESDIYVSSGSACAKGRPSHVLAAMGLPRDRIDGALRVSFSEENTPEDVDAFCRTLAEGLRTLAGRR